MIQEFSVQNFLSFREKQTVSFVATPDKKLRDELTYETKPGGVRLLRLALVYGANASGKSNLLQAIQALWFMLFIPQDKEHKEVYIYEPFELNKGKPVSFEIIFWANGRKYQYELVYDKYTVLYEKMLYTSDKDVLSLMYERKQDKSVLFGSTVGIKSEQRKDLIKDTFPNHTLLSTLNKKNIDVPPVIKELYDWIKKNVHELGIYNDVLKIAEQADTNPSIKEFILELLKRADFDITDFNVVDFSLPENLINEIKDFDILTENAKDKLLRPRKQILFMHGEGHDSFQITFGLESAGTRAYFRLARLLYDLKHENCVLMEDELDDSLHFDLLIHYLKTYLQASCCSQLIFTTHNQLLLGEEWLIRRDMVYFVEKDRKTYSSILYRASDMGIHKNVSLMNAYKIGKLGAKPTLGSTFLTTGEV